MLPVQNSCGNYMSAFFDFLELLCKSAASQHQVFFILFCVTRTDGSKSVLMDWKQSFVSFQITANTKVLCCGVPLKCISLTMIQDSNLLWVVQQLTQPLQRLLVTGMKPALARIYCQIKSSNYPIPTHVDFLDNEMHHLCGCALLKHLQRT